MDRNGKKTNDKVIKPLQKAVDIEKQEMSIEVWESFIPKWVCRNLEQYSNSLIPEDIFELGEKQVLNELNRLGFKTMITETIWYEDNTC